jgi:hypothetical protein
MRILLLVLGFLALTSCKKEASEIPLSEMSASAAQLVVSGTFQNGPYGRVSGQGQIWKTAADQYEIVLDNFQTTNGPDLFVYLSKEPMPVNFIDAGKLKSTNGRQIYPISGSPDFTQYKYIVIHCKAFNHLFGFAPLP